MPQVVMEVEVRALRQARGAQALVLLLALGEQVPGQVRVQEVQASAFLGACDERNGHVNHI